MTRATRRRSLQNQIHRLNRQLTQLQQRSERYGWARVVAFLSALVLSLLAYFTVSDWLFWVVLIPSLVAFGVLVAIHRRIEATAARYTLWSATKRAQIARLDVDWDHIPDQHLAQPDHPLEADLDLVGPYSLYRLLDTPVTTQGSQCLRAWLTNPVPDPEQTLARQTLVRELLPLTTLRNRLDVEARLAVGTNPHLAASRLQSWLAAGTSVASLRLPILVLSVLAAITAFHFGLDLLNLLPPVWFFTLVLYAALLLVASRNTGEIFDEALALQGGLQQLSAVSQVLERYRYRNAPNLRRLCTPFLDDAHGVSRYLSRMQRLLFLIGIGQNPYLSFALNLVLPWNLYCAYWLGQYKAAVAPHLLLWLDRWFELEALSALATFAYLNPSYTFPEVQPADSTPIFRATGLGHPLLPHDAKICNDFALNAQGEVVIITGSNMSGKSSFLRTVGVNLVLAYAGGPVNATSLQTIPFRLFTCIRVSDSVTEGLSYFYAEVKRLRALLDELERPDPLPLFFFIDEIFRGTNNRERLIGSRAYIRALVGQHGVGLVSTHDLELVQLADESPQIENYHFREEVVADQMVFDYRLRPGPSPTTNALKIMQMAGLPVPTLTPLNDLGVTQLPDSRPTLPRKL